MVRQLTANKIVDYETLPTNTFVQITRAKFYMFVKKIFKTNFQLLKKCISLENSEIRYIHDSLQ